VEASCASAFREKRRRMAVDAAGIMVELFLAAVALFVWIYVETGIVHAIAYNVILIGGVSTLLFNGNPLLRFDGYYFLSDALEIPNLGSRSTNYIGYLIQRYVFGSKRAISPASGPGEKGWLLTYGVLSFFYRLFIVATISLFIAQKFFIVGVILAIWAVFTMVVLPLYRKVVFLVRSPQITGHRVRAWVASLAFVLGLSGFIFYVPFPYATRAEGVVWPPENSLVRVSADGFCRSIVSRPNQWVRRGDPIFVNEDPLLSAEKKVLLKRLKELEARYFSLRFTDKTQAAIQKEEMVSVRFQLNRIDEKESQLIVRSPAEGVLIIPRMEDMKDRFLHKGELVAYVVQYPLNTVRVVVPQESIGLVKDQTVRVDVRLSDRVPHIYPAQVRREVPAATDKLPSVALGFAGGGEVAIDPSEEGGTKAFDTIFQLDLDVPDTAQARYIGGRVFVRFDHGKVTLAEQWYRSIRQLLLRRFSI
ncbi:MAG: hypothetical protein GWN88_18950, partial [Nitrospinaceae bacterium]|nr:hypothetical protein [Nitrospinaceae bacterium]NIU98232.1 hypothetical protein [Nitrospinaceae bacterium]